MIRHSFNKNIIADILNTARALLENFTEQSDERNEQAFRDAAGKLDVKLGSMLMPVRVAVTGTQASPPLFGSLRLLGEGKALQRINRAINLLSGTGTKRGNGQ